MRIILKFEIDPFTQTRDISQIRTSSGSVFLNFHGIILFLGSVIYHFPFGFSWAMNHLEMLQYTVS